MPANAWVSARRYLCYMIAAAYLRHFIFFVYSVGIVVFFT